MLKDENKSELQQWLFLALWEADNRKSYKEVCEIDVNRQRETVRQKAAIKAITNLRYAVVIRLGLGVGIVSSIYFQHRRY